MCSINWGNGFGHFFKALSKPYEESGRIFVVLQKFGVATGVICCKPQISGHGKGYCRRTLRERLKEIPKSLSQ